MWDIRDCEGCFYLKDGKCWFKHYPEDIPEDTCTEVKLQGDGE